MEVPVDQINSVDISQMEDFSPEGIAQFLFNQEPKSTGSCEIITENDGADLSYVFEILLTILLEGLEILSNGLDHVDLAEITPEHILGLNPWFYSLGFKIRIIEKEYKDQEDFQDYYCKVLTKHFNAVWFQIKGIEKSYTFNLNGNFLELNKERKNLKELFAVFKNGSKAYLISFDRVIG